MTLESILTVPSRAREDLDYVLLRIDEVRRTPQTAAREVELSLLEFQKRRLEGKRELEVATTADHLFRAFQRMGHADVMVGGRRVRIEAPTGTTGVQTVWNIREACNRAARQAYDYAVGLRPD